MFYRFRQNNSGGFFTGPAINVIVEADSQEESQRLAEQHGLYFDGRGDCPCCGNRWAVWPLEEYETFEEAFGYVFPATVNELQNNISNFIFINKDGEVEHES